MPITSAPQLPPVLAAHDSSTPSDPVTVAPAGRLDPFLAPIADLVVPDLSVDDESLDASVRADGGGISPPQESLSPLQALGLQADPEHRAAGLFTFGTIPGLPSDPDAVRDARLKLLIADEALGPRSFLLHAKRDAPGWTRALDDLGLTADELEVLNEAHDALDAIFGPELVAGATPVEGKAIEVGPALGKDPEDVNRDDVGLVFGQGLTATE